MDDLDHSMHIAEYDWVSFYEESEECGLLQPSLACLDNLSLSDSEESGNSSSVFSRGPAEPQQRPAANSDDVESNTAGCRMEQVQINQEGSEVGQDNHTPQAEKDIKTGVKSDLSLDYPEGNTINTEGVHTKTEHITEETNDDITTTLQTEQLIGQYSDGESTELKKEDGDMQTGSESSSTHDADPLSHRLTELNVNEPHTTDRDASEDGRSVASRAEKERWFVTVNDSPARQRARENVPVKKKRRQKKPRKNNHMYQTAAQEESLENGLKMAKKTKDNNESNNESEGGRNTENVTQSNQNLGGNQSDEENLESALMGVDPDSFQVSLRYGEEDTLSDKPVTAHTIEPTVDRNKHDPSTSSTSADTFTPTDLSQLDSVESDELGDGVEFFSTHSYDSESYLSATESVEDPQHLHMENQLLQSSPSLFNLTENADVDDTYDREIHSCQSTLSCDVTATNCGSYESTNAEPTLTFPSVAQSTNKMPDDNSTCDEDSHSTLLCMPSATPEIQKHDINLSASGCSSGEQLSHPPVPDVTLTPCSVADSPETYAEAEGHTRPVYAISAFWDEMEKLTINDILQLRIGRGTPPTDTQETKLNVDDFSTNHSSLVDTVEYNLSDGGLMDTSDTADSDYFTQPDESKPDRSSCEFSTSDFEEEYWQFLGASRNTSPDSQSKNQQWTSDSPHFAHEDEESSEGKETPVPLEDFAGECFEDQDSNDFISSELAWPSRMTKSKSVHNVQALNTEDLSLQLLVGNDESSLLLSSCPSLEENVVLNASDSLGTLKPAHFLSNTYELNEHTPISFPESFEYFLTEDKAKRDSWCVTVYDPEDISVAPVFDYTLCTFRDETSFSSLPDSRCSKEKPIPIFSCSHPTVRELTIPNPDYFFLSADREEEYDISPIRVVSQSFIQGSDCGKFAKAGFRSWKTLQSWRIRFHDKGSIWCGRSGAWVFPVEVGKNTGKRADPLITVATEERQCSTPSQLFKELAVQQRILETIQATRREGLFSTLQQSDMCLVCIAFASWVLKSSDPEAADAWKAALLANVSALSAIQYLRHYVKKKNP